MIRLVIAIALFTACRGGKSVAKHDDAGRDGSSSRVSVVPKLLATGDGAAELSAIDKRIEIHAVDRSKVIPLLLERAAIRGRVEDYQRALTESSALVADTPNDSSLQLRIHALMRAHKFSEARATLKKLEPLVHPSHLTAHLVALDEATGQVDRALAGREQLAKAAPSATNLTLWAASLGATGRLDEALAIMPKAGEALRNNTPQVVAWMLFQWGRLYEQKGEHAAAKQFYAEAHARLPGSVETISHLAETLVATSDRAAAKTLVATALVDNDHPALRALAHELGGGPQAELAAIAAEWERYVNALPEAFADHAARFYLGVGGDPKRALELAKQDLDNRDTRHARVLVVEAAIAAGDAAAACLVIDPLMSGTRAERFMAWKALSACGRTADADRVARELGI